MAQLGPPARRRRLCPAPEAGVETLIQRADIAMYSAKEGGGGYAMFEPRLDRFSPRRLSLAGGLRQAIQNGEMREWRDGGELSVAVNLSARSFLDTQLAVDILRLLAEHDVDAALLELEITESMLMRS